MFVNITEKPPWGSVIKAITITITMLSDGGLGLQMYYQVFIQKHKFYPRRGRD